MHLGLMFALGLLAAGPLALGVLWLAARLGDLLPDDPAEVALHFSQGGLISRDQARAYRNTPRSDMRPDLRLGVRTSAVALAMVSAGRPVPSGSNRIIARAQGQGTARKAGSVC